MRRLLVAILPLATGGNAQAMEADVRPLLHPLFADHAVLPRDAKVPVWGWASPGTRITVRFADQEKNAVTGNDGKWVATLDPMPASPESRTLDVESPASNLKTVVTDILVGDVWLCSGQSNMEMGVGLCKVPEEIAKADFPAIRILTVPHRISHAPESTLEAEWLPCSPASLMHGVWGGFSAAAYFFGRNLHRELGVPIGLIHASWGGTVCEAWTSREALIPLGDYQSGIARVDEVSASPAADKLNAVMDRWYQAHDPGTAKKWFKPETDIFTWKEATMPSGWSKYGISEGIVWARRSFNSPAGWEDRGLVLGLGPISDVDTTWINGTLVGRTDYFDQTRIYQVPAGVVKAGENVITMRISNAGSGGFFGTPDQLKIYPVGEESSAVSLAGPWHIQDTATRASTGAPLAGNPNVPTVLYNGMIAPLTPFAIKGAIWYQGEANTGEARNYRTLLPAMIRDWRSRFGVGDFGFHIVSLANYEDASDEPQDSGWAELREAQAMTAKAVPHCGMATTIDIGEADDIHPQNKAEVGRRLALSALALTYGKPVEWSGPWYRSMEATGSGIRLSFDHSENGLIAKGGKLTGFAIAGDDRKFYQANAVIEGDSVMVSSPSVAKPTAVRYGWSANPACNLFNRENLPAVPFRTDDWTTGE